MPLCSGRGGYHFPKDLAVHAPWNIVKCDAVAKYITEIIIGNELS